MAKKARTKDGLKILDRLIGDDPKMRRRIEREREKADIGQQVYDARMEAGLTQQQLAKLVDTTPSVIARQEDADYEEPSLHLLQRIARALGRTIHVELRREGIAEDAR